MNKLLTKLLEKAEANSRFVFLVQGISTAIAVLYLSVAFVFAHDRSGYPVMVTSLLGGGFMAHFGRRLTKNPAAAEKPETPHDNPASQ